MKSNPSQLYTSLRYEGSTRLGYTLIELVVVVVIMGILASSAVPVLNQSTQARQGASRDEAVRMLEFARGRAISGGVPVGVQIGTNTATLLVLTLDDSGDVVSVIDPIGGGTKSVDLSEQYAGVTIDSFINGDGVGGNGTVWFDYQAEPHTRDGVSGSFDALFTQNGTITLSTGTVVVVHAGTGFVEVR